VGGGTSAISDVTVLWRGIPAQFLPPNVCPRISYSYLKCQNYIPYETTTRCRKTYGVGGNHSHPPLGSPRVLVGVRASSFGAIYQDAT